MSRTPVTNTFLQRKSLEKAREDFLKACTQKRDARIERMRELAERIDRRRSRFAA